MKVVLFTFEDIVIPKTSVMESFNTIEEAVEEIRKEISSLAKLSGEVKMGFVVSYKETT